MKGVTFEEGLGVACLLLVAVAIAVLNDRSKARAMRKAIERGRQPHPAWQNNKTDWQFVARLVLFCVLLLAALYNVPGKAEWFVIMRQTLLITSIVLAAGTVAWRSFNLLRASGAGRVATSGEPNTATGADERQ